jgi:hypothetical protein
MSPSQLTALGLGTVALACLVALSLGRWLEKRRLFSTAPAGGVAEGEAGTDSVAYPPSLLYLVALWLVLAAIGLASSTFALVLLGVLGAAAVARLWLRGGVELTKDAIVFGQGDRTAIAYGDISAVVAAPRGRIGRQWGTFGLLDADGRWCAAIRYQWIRHGGVAVADLIRRAHLSLAKDGSAWTRDGRPITVPSFPVVGPM